MTNIVGYARESTLDQAHNGFNMDDQARRITEFCEFEYGQEPYELSIRREEGRSGKNLERPEIQKILQQAESHEIDIVVVYCLDRLTRSLTDLYELLEQFQKCQVSLVAITDHIDTSTPMGRFFVSIIVLIAQWELDTLSSRTERGIAESLMQGNYARGKIPFGFKRKDDDPHLIEISPDDAAIIRRIFTEISEDRESCYTLAKKMKEEKLLDRMWSELGLKVMIQNRLYYGCLQTKDFTHENYIEPIVTKEVWDKANEVISNKKYDRKDYFYGDQVFCSCCKHPMDHVCTTKKSIGKTYLYYKCPKCKGTISEDKITEEIHDKMNYISKVTHCDNELRLLKDRYIKLDYKMKQLVYFVSEFGLDENYAQCELERMHQKQTELSNQIEQIAKETKQHYYIGINRDEQKEVLETYVSKITITFPGKKCRVIYTDQFNEILERRTKQR